MKYIVIFEIIQSVVSSWPQNNTQYRVFDSKEQVNEFIKVDKNLTPLSNRYEIVSVYKAEEIKIIKKTRIEKEVTEKEIIESMRIE